MKGGGGGGGGGRAEVKETGEGQEGKRHCALASGGWQLLLANY